jgi:hypothetical protein
MSPAVPVVLAAVVVVVVVVVVFVLCEAFEPTPNISPILDCSGLVCPILMRVILVGLRGCRCPSLLLPPRVRPESLCFVVVGFVRDLPVSFSSPFFHLNMACPSMVKTGMSRLPRKPPFCSSLFLLLMVVFLEVSALNVLLCLLSLRF